MIAKKKPAPMPRRTITPRRGTPVPMPEYKPKRPPGAATPVPMPTRDGNYGKPRVTQRPKPGNPKKTPSPKLELPIKPKRGPGKSRIKGTPVRRKMM